MPMMLHGQRQLLIALVLTNVIHTREQRATRERSVSKDDQPLSGSGGFKLVLGNRYLLAHRPAHTGGPARQHQRQLHSERDAGPDGRDDAIARGSRR